MNFIVTRSIEPSLETLAMVDLPFLPLTNFTNEDQSLKRVSLVRIYICENVTWEITSGTKSTAGFGLLESNA